CLSVTPTCDRQDRAKRFIWRHDLVTANPWTPVIVHGAAAHITPKIAPKTGGGPAVVPPGPLAYQPTCKPGSVGRNGDALRVTAIPLGRRLPGASSNLPGRPDPDIDPDAACAAPRVPIRSCSRWGLPCRRRCRRRGALLPHLFTLTAADTQRAAAVCSLWHFP